MDAYAAAKLRLFTDLAEQSGKPYRAVINISDEWGRQFAAKAKGAVYTYGECECALVRAVRAEYGHDALRFWVRTALATNLLPSPLQVSPRFGEGRRAQGCAPALPPACRGNLRGGGPKAARANISCTPR
jgi:hypothetical protein